ncbi:unnamed protein product [Parajaminaea phylloscopi]
MSTADSAINARNRLPTDVPEASTSQAVDEKSGVKQSLSSSTPSQDLRSAGSGVEEQLQGDLSDSDTSSDEDDGPGQGNSQSKKRRETAGNEAEEVDAEELQALRREQEEQAEKEGYSLDASEAQLGRGKRRRKDDASETKTQNTKTASIQSAADEETWKAFKADVSAQGGLGSASEAARLVKVVERYRFAGEDVVKERLLPADHPDAVKFLERNPQEKPLAAGAKQGMATTTGLDSAGHSQTAPATSSESEAAASQSSEAVAQSTAAQSVTTSQPPSRRPPPMAGRKKRTSKLSALAAAADTSSGRKMNTLEKSKMDWDDWKQQGTDAASAPRSQREMDEMEEQTRTGSAVSGNSMSGYLGRKDFLERVRDRTGH